VPLASALPTTQAAPAMPVAARGSHVRCSQGDRDTDAHVPSTAGRIPSGRNHERRSGRDEPNERGIGHNRSSSAFNARVVAGDSTATRPVSANISNTTAITVGEIVRKFQASPSMMSWTSTIGPRTHDTRRHRPYTQYPTPAPTTRKNTAVLTPRPTRSPSTERNSAIARARSASASIATTPQPTSRYGRDRRRTSSASSAAFGSLTSAPYAHDVIDRTMAIPLCHRAIVDRISVNASKARLLGAPWNGEMQVPIRVYHTQGTPNRL